MLHVPALLTSTSKRPNSSFTRSKALEIDSSSSMSISTVLISLLLDGNSDCAVLAAAFALLMSRPARRMV